MLRYHKIYFLTKEGNQQYDKAIYILENNLIYFDNIPNIIPNCNNMPLKSEEYLYLNFFRNWIVGFTIAEGSFLIKNNGAGCFQLRQQIHIKLFEAFKLIFKTKRKIGIDKNNLYCLFSVSFKRDIQEVINFFFVLRSLFFIWLSIKSI